MDTVNIPELLEKLERKHEWAAERPRQLAINVDVEDVRDAVRVLRAVVLEGFNRCE